MLLFAVVIASVLLLWLNRGIKSVSSPPIANEPATNRSTAALEVAPDQSVVEINKLLVADYHSTNENDAITSALAHQLIAEQLRTNVAFLEWATNAAKAVIVSFIAKTDIPVYGASGLTSDALQLHKVTVNGQVGMYAEAIYDPDPANEGPLAFIVEGGIHPTLLRVQNGYRLESYQMRPELWSQSSRKIGRMDWSSAVRPLEKNQVNMLARHAFHEMTGLDLASFHVEQTKMDVEGLLNPNASHPDVTVTGNINARLYTPKDYVYPFAAFSYGGGGSVLVAFSGEMVQTSPGRGEFVDLFAVVKKTEAIFELGEKFLGQGTWEQAMLDNVRSLNTQERGQIYRRIFQQ